MKTFFFPRPEKAHFFPGPRKKKQIWFSSKRVIELATSKVHHEKKKELWLNKISCLMCQTSNIFDKMVETSVVLLNGRVKECTFFGSKNRVETIEFCTKTNQICPEKVNCGKISLFTFWQCDYFDSKKNWTKKSPTHHRRPFSHFLGSSACVRSSVPSKDLDRFQEKIKLTGVGVAFFQPWGSVVTKYHRKLSTVIYMLTLTKKIRRNSLQGLFLEGSQLATEDYRRL